MYQCPMKSAVAGPLPLAWAGVDARLPGRLALAVSIRYKPAALAVERPQKLTASPVLFSCANVSARFREIISNRLPDGALMATSRFQI